MQQFDCYTYSSPHKSKSTNYLPENGNKRIWIRHCFSAISGGISLRQKESRSQTRLTKFQNPFERQRFYFEHENLKLQHVGIEADQRIYISENLTKANQPIFAAQNGAEYIIQCQPPLAQSMLNRGRFFFIKPFVLFATVNVY
jgi:hypothetical protein